MKKLINIIKLIADDALLVAGAYFIVHGAFAIYVPAGYITVGISFLGLAYLTAKRKDIS